MHGGFVRNMFSVVRQPFFLLWIGTPSESQAKGTQIEDRHTDLLCFHICIAICAKTENRPRQKQSLCKGWHTGIIIYHSYSFLGSSKLCSCHFKVVRCFSTYIATKVFNVVLAKRKFFGETSCLPTISQ